MEEDFFGWVGFFFYEGYVMVLFLMLVFFVYYLYDLNLVGCMDIFKKLCVIVEMAC